MKPYPQELRLRVLTACHAGGSTQEVAEQLEVSESWVRRVKQRYREGGEIDRRPSGGDRCSKLDDEALECLRRMVEEQPDLTLEQLREQVERRLKTKLSVAAIGRSLRKLGLSFKKSRSTRASATARTSSRSAARSSATSARPR